MLDLIMRKLKYTSDEEANRIIHMLRCEIEDLERLLEKEKTAHRRTRTVYRRVIGALRMKFVGVDVLISQLAKEYDGVNRK